MTSRIHKTHAAVTQDHSALTRYQDVIIGRRSSRATFHYELCMWLALVPGALGIFLRKIFWPPFFGSCGKGVVFGANITVRHPHRIHIGNRVVISEGCILDARNSHLRQVILLEDDCILSNSVMISCKGGSVTIGARCGIGAQTIIQSSTDEPVLIGEDVIIGPRCYITGGGNYNMDRIDMPIRQQGKRIMGGSTLEDGVWLGANVTVLGGVTIGAGSVAAAGAVVTNSIVSRAICMGVPAKVVKLRTQVKREGTQ